MAKFWITEARSWRLPAETDIVSLREHLTEAMRTGELTTVTVEMNDNPLQRGEIVVNPTLLLYVAVIEFDE